MVLPAQRLRASEHIYQWQQRCPNGVQKGMATDKALEDRRPQTERINPPSTRILVPVTYEAALLARNATTLAKDA